MSENQPAASSASTGRNSRPPATPTADGRRWRTLGRTLFCILLLFVFPAVYWVSEVARHFGSHWYLDFRYFWTAGRVWLDHGAVYGADYAGAGARAFTYFANPFFYPPAIIPFFAALAVLTPQTAASLFLIFNAAALLAAARSLQKIGAHTDLPGANLYGFGVCFAVCFCLFSHTADAAVYGQTAILLGLAFALFILAVLTKSEKLAAAALVILLFKPQLGLALLTYSIARKDTRRAAVYAVIATGALSLIGLAGADPLLSAKTYLENLAAYGAKPENAAAHSAGLGFLLSLADLKLSQLLTLLCCVAIPAGIGRLHRDSGPPLLASLCLCATVAIFSAPNHSTDYIVLAPASLLIFSPGAVSGKFALAGSCFLLGQTWPLLYMLEGRLRFDPDLAAAAIHTCALTLLVVILAQTMMNGIIGFTGFGRGLKMAKHG